MENEIKNLQKEFEKLNAEEVLLDYWITKTNEDLQNFAKNEENTQYAFLTFSDLMSLKKSSENSETFLIIKAPKGTTMEIPESSEGNIGEYENQLILHCEEGEIVPFIVSENKIYHEMEGERNENRNFI